MTKNITVPNSTLEQLAHHRRPGETLGATITRLLNELDPDPLAAPAPDRLAESVLTVRDLRALEERGYSPTEYLEVEFDLDPADFNGDADALREALSEARRE
ncbi:hypothetical protein [Halorarum salinum]|uniref:Uncharacterized protein n=1 Tax=Halorarum salinum TaxID=2743089 RepID=A0A7D5QHB1_9EURY|nr:hypothetical protein [Halobaculum salinum]QLG62642.1 hypothetical protein HUG12_13275 [Halobaculum salinum]